MSESKLTFPASSPFFADVKARVDAHFTRTGASKHGNASMAVKTFFWLALLATTWSVVTFGVLAFPLALLVWALLGFTMAQIGFNVGHDAIHKSMSKRTWVNALFGRTFDVMGGASKTWERSHNMVHHTYTNVRGVDSDLEPGPFMRFYPKDEKPHFLHRFQPIYAWFLYGFTSLVWVFKKDFVQLVEHKAGKRMVIDVLTGKAVHFTLFLVLPMVFSGLAFWQLAIGYVLMLAVAGVTLATVFQLAHVVEGVEFPRVKTDNSLPEPWAENVMRTTADFGRSRVTTFFTGGLDHQIEHHLFPRICHVHYAAIAPIVEQCAKDHGLPYLHSGTFPSAVVSHARVLHKLGTGEIVGDVSAVVSPPATSTSSPGLMTA